jgi:DNA polymerase (family 10)
MTNNEIAQFLYDISDMLEIKGGNPFKVRAYKTAAKSVEHLTQDLEDIHRGKGVLGLQQIEGIGERIAQKISELLKTGKCKYYDALAKEVPKEELQLIRIPQIGPKTAKKLYEKLNIKSIDDLQKAAQSRKIQKLPSFDAKTEENILKNIGRFSKREKRMLISFAQPIAQEILLYLKKCPYVSQAETVGSLRRFKETIGDIDVVVSSSRPQKVIEHFINFPRAKQIVAKGKTKASILHQKEDSRVDLEILDPKSYGSLLQHLTGSKEHNVHLRKYANELGLSLSEYGILNLKIKKREFFANEKKFYKRLGLQFIEPKLREDRGEIETALKQKLPKLIKIGDIKGDLHIHTTWSEGKMSIQEVAQEACNLRYKYIAICDHSAGLGVASGVTEEKLLKQTQEIEKINKKIPSYTILSGVEVNIKADGSLDISDKVLQKLDIVVASVHSALSQPEEKMTKRLLLAIYNPNVHIIGHPSGRILKKEKNLTLNGQRFLKPVPGPILPWKLIVFQRDWI